MPGILGRTAIITGAAGGIGRELSRSFLAGGASVVLSDVDGEALEKARAALAEQGAQEMVAVAGDLSAPGTAERLVEAALEAFGRLDILVANAGGGVVRRTREHTEETLQATIDRNLWTAIRSALAVIPHLQAQQYGRVVFMGADSVRNGLDGHAIYNAAKGGVHAMARGLAREYAADGITFNVVSPCATRTPELDRFLREDPALADRFLRVIPAGRPAELREVASATMYLASEEAGFITGQVLPVNGGSTMV
jgi:2,3-dihydroxy-2,3-dihydro-p-cumate dehydrogenase